MAIVPYAMGTGDIAGGVIVVVKDGEVLAQKGYGYADVATQAARRSASARCSARVRSRSS